MGSETLIFHMGNATADVDVVSTSRAGLCHTAKLENEADIDKYVADIKAKLMQQLNGHDVLHII